MDFVFHMEEKQFNFCLGVPENTERTILISLRGRDIKKMVFG